MITIGTLKAMEQSGQWSEIRQLGAAVLDGHEGDALSRALLALGSAFEHTATGAADYRQALAFAQAAVASAERGGLLHTWSIARVAAYAADLGLYQVAMQAAATFLDALPRHEAAQRIAPWVLYALGRVRASQRRYSEAAGIWRLVIGTAPDELAERARLHLAWTLAESGRLADAYSVLPTAAEYCPSALLEAARAVLCAAAHNWQGVIEHGRAYLNDAGALPVCDTIQTAEICLLMHRATNALGQHSQAEVWLRKAAAVLSCWNRALMQHLVPTLQGEGGAWHNAAVSRCGGAGTKRTGLRGVLG